MEGSILEFETRFPLIGQSVSEGEFQHRAFVLPLRRIP